MKKLLLVMGLLLGARVHALESNFLEYMNNGLEAQMNLPFGEWKTSIWYRTAEDQAQAKVNCQNQYRQYKAAVDKMIDGWMNQRRAEIRKHPQWKMIPREKNMQNWYRMCERDVSSVLVKKRNAANYAEKILHTIVPVTNTALQSIYQNAVQMRKGFVEAVTEVNNVIAFSQDPYTNSADYGLSKLSAFGKVLTLMKQKIDIQVLEQIKEAGKTFNIQIQQKVVDLLEDQIKLLTDETNGEPRYKLFKCPGGDQCNKIIGKISSIINQLLNSVIDQVNEVLKKYVSE